MAIPELYKDSLEYAQLRADFWKNKLQKYKILLDKSTKSVLTKILTKSMQRNRIAKLKEIIQECKKEAEFWEEEIEHWEKKINASAGNTN